MLCPCFCINPWLLFPSASLPSNPSAIAFSSRFLNQKKKPLVASFCPDTAKEKPQVGEVVQVGPGKPNEDGSRQAPEVGVGDKVLYSKYAGTDIKLGSDEYVLLSEKDILAIVN